MGEYINVNLYGDGSRKIHYRAEYIYCENCSSCSLFKEGKCFNVTVPFGEYCPVGRISRTDLGTKQSTKCLAETNKVRKNEKYNKLSYPNSCRVYTVDNIVCLSLPRVGVKYNEEEDKLTVDNTFFFNNRIVSISVEKLTNDKLNKICSYVPKTFFENAPIKDYQEEIVPEFLIQLKTLLPDIYERFVSEYPQYKTEFEDINYCGKRAYLATCNTDPEIIYRDIHKNAFHFVKDSPTKMICESYTTGFSPFGAKAYTVIIDVNDTMICEITDNKQVLRTTKFT